MKGRKRHVAVDTSGLLLGVLVHAADIQDADGACDLRRRIKPLSCWLEAVFADSAYHRLSLMIVCFLLGLTLIIVRRIADATGFVVLPRRWGVERTPGWLGRWRLARPLAAGSAAGGWLGRWRRLSKDYEELPAVSETMVTLAMIRIMLHRLVHPNRKQRPTPTF